MGVNRGTLIYFFVKSLNDFIEFQHKVNIFFKFLILEIYGLVLFYKFVQAIYFVRIILFSSNIIAPIQ